MGRKKRLTGVWKQKEKEGKVAYNRRKEEEEE